MNHKKEENTMINITFPDGNVKQFENGITAEAIAVLLAEFIFTVGFEITALIFTVHSPYRLIRLFTAKIPPIPEATIKTTDEIIVFSPTSKSHKTAEIRIVSTFIGSAYKIPTNKPFSLSFKPA